MSKRAPALRATVSLVLALFTASCTGLARHGALDGAEAAVERVRGAPRVRALAAAELNRAELALEHARAAARAGAPPDQIAHMAYVVSQRAALAEARAAERVARSELGKLQRTLDQVVAQGPRPSGQRRSAAGEPGQRAPTWRQEHQQARAFLEDEEQAAPAQGDRRGGGPPDDGRAVPSPAERELEHTRLRRDLGEAVPGAEDRRARAPLEQHPGGAAWTTRGERGHAPPERNRPQATPGAEDRPPDAAEQHRSEGTALAVRDLEQRAAQDRRGGTALAGERQTHAAEPERRAGVPLDEGRRADPLPEQALRQETAREDRPQATPGAEDPPAPAAEQHRSEGTALAARDPGQRAALEQDRRGGTALAGERQTHAAEPERRAGVPLPDSRRHGAPLEEKGRAGAPVEDERQVDPLAERDPGQRAALEQGRRGDTPVAQRRQALAPRGQVPRERASVRESQPARLALELGRERGAVPPGPHVTAREQEAVAAAVEPAPRDVTLRLAHLPFDGAEPTGETLAELVALAERLLLQPGSRAVIEADFDLPDPEARTEMERRVEVVRAILLRRGVEAARLVVRAAGNGARPPPASSPFVAAPD